MIFCAGGTEEPSIDEYGSSTIVPHDHSTGLGLAYRPNWMSTQTTQELLYVTLSVVLGSSLLTLIAVMFVCAWRQRQRQRILGFTLSSLLVTYSRDVLCRAVND